MEVKKQNNIIKLSGNIDEFSNFETLIGKVEPNSVFNCAGVSKINSNGVKLWITYFSNLKKQTQFSFEDFSPVLVEQLNSLSYFSVGAVVHSLMVPFACTQCKKETIVSMTVEALKANPDPDPIYCSHCKGRAEFDDLPEEYFCCLENLP